VCAHDAQQRIFIRAPIIMELPRPATRPAPCRQDEPECARCKKWSWSTDRLRMRMTMA